MWLTGTILERIEEALAFPFLLASLWLVGLPPGAWAGDPAPSLTSEQKAWALATSAMLFQRNMEAMSLESQPRVRTS